MSLLSDWKFRELMSFGGAWLNRDRTMIDTRGAIEARNVEFMTGSVGTRHGFQQIADWGQLQTIELYEWLGPFSEMEPHYVDNALVTVFLTGDDVPHVRVQNLHTTGTHNGNGIMGGFQMARPNPPPPVLNGGGATVISVGMNLYVSCFDQNQRSVYPATVVRMWWDATFNFPQIAGVGGDPASSPGQDNDKYAAFPGPSTYGPIPAVTAGSYTTAGTHRFGYLIEYRTGFTTRVSPDNSYASNPGVATFVPIVVNVSAGQQIQFPFLANWASPELGGIVAISMVMTTTTNLNQYYVVPGSRTLNDGVAAVTINVDISDGDLSSRGVDATPYLYWLTMPANSTVPNAALPFAVRHLALWADRLVYLATVNDNQGNLIDALYVSERNNCQAITADQHILQLPGQRVITTMFRMGSVNYILGPHEIWGVSDNGDVPVTWAAPGMVDGRHGTLAIKGAEVAPSGDRAWIADQAGLFLFTGGPILDLPLSYYQTPDWERINWVAASAVKIKDDSGSRRVCVMVPLDGAIQATHVMTWDYTDGLTPETVRYSLNFIAATGGTLPQLPLGAMELMRNDMENQGGNTGRVELWVAIWTPNADTPTGSGYQGLMRHMSDLDTDPFRDAIWGIDSKWSGPPFPGRDMGMSIIQHHHGFHARLRGQGIVTPIIWDIDKKNSFPCRPVTLVGGPDQDELVLADIINELAYVSLETKLVDNYFRLAFLRWYYTPYIMQR